MVKISTNKEINIFINKIIETKKWRIVHKNKHTILKHLVKESGLMLIVSSTPSDIHAYSNFRKDYYRRLRTYFIKCGLILNQRSKND